MAHQSTIAEEIKVLHAAHAKEIQRMAEEHARESLIIKSAAAVANGRILHEAQEIKEKAEAATAAIHTAGTYIGSGIAAVVEAAEFHVEDVSADISEHVDLSPVMNVSQAVYDVLKEPQKAVDEANETATRLAIEVNDHVREAQELAEATVAAAQAEALRVEYVAKEQVKAAQARVKEVERQAAEAVYERARKIANQFAGSKNWEGKTILPNYERKKAEVEDQARVAAEVAKQERAVESEAKSVQQVAKKKAEEAAHHASATAKKIGHIQHAKKHKKKHKH